MNKFKLILVSILALVSFNIDAVAKDRPSGRGFKLQVFVGSSHLELRGSDATARIDQGGLAVIKPLSDNKKNLLRSYVGVGIVDPDAQGKEDFLAIQAGVMYVRKVSKRFAVAGGPALTFLDTPAGDEWLPTLSAGTSTKFKGNLSLLTPVFVHEKAVGAGLRLAFTW